MEFEPNGSYYQRDQDYPLHREDSNQSIMSEREEELAARALDRISRARALGKTSIKLSQAEIDILDRMERARPRDQRPQQMQQPETKVAAPPKPTAVNKKTARPKAIEAAKHKRADSPKGKMIYGRIRNHSNVSTRSAREDDLVTYQIPQDSDNGYEGRSYSNSHSSYQGSPLRPRSRTNSSHNIRQAPGPVFAPYYSNPGRYVSMPEAQYHRRMESGPASYRPSRLDPTDAANMDYYTRSRSNSNANLRSYPLDQLPNPTQTTRVPRFDPDDPHYAPPSRRVVSGTSVPLQRRPSDELYLHLPDDPEVMNYMVPPPRSSSGSDASYRDRPSRHSLGRANDSERDDAVKDLHEPSNKKAPTVKTRSAAAATTTSSKATSKASVKGTRRR